MRACLGTTALVAGIIAGTTGITTNALAQAGAVGADSAPRFSLFGGRALGETPGPEEFVEMGVSGDFRWHPIPVPLRLALSFSEQRFGRDYSASPRGGAASLEAVMRPVPGRFGIRPYFLAGLGVQTRSGYGFYGNADPFAPSPVTYIERPRESWAFASAGLGLDVGRAFVQLRVLNPVATRGPILVPISVGIRFWD